jgi:hypothetical protein
VIDTLLSELKSFWRHNQFNKLQEKDDGYVNKELRIKGAFLTLVSRDNKKKLEEYIEHLKDNEIIYQKYNTIGNEIVEIVDEATKLANDIKKELVDIL